MTGKTNFMMGQQVRSGSFRWFQSLCVCLWSNRDREDLLHDGATGKVRQLLMVLMSVCVPMVEQGQGRPTP